MFLGWVFCQSSTTCAACPSSIYRGGVTTDVRQYLLHHQKLDPWGQQPKMLLILPSAIWSCWMQAICPEDTVK